jgi:hypothetical protein
VSTLAHYPPPVAELLAAAPRNGLGRGEPRAEWETRLAALRPESLGTARGRGGLADPTMAQACLAGLWLRFDFLDRSHALSQQIETPAGSYWHGIMHRREGDSGNARYWFRQAGPLAALEPVAGYVQIHPQGKFRTWDPVEFVSWCEGAQRSGDPPVAWCQGVQLVEWEALFDHCFRRAVGLEG